MMPSRSFHALPCASMPQYETRAFSRRSAPLDEVGRMLGGWNGQVAKQNSPARAEEK
jgi:hypothetical protein